MNFPVRDIAIPPDWDRTGLPGWAYASAELLELEKELLFRRHWQLICHVSDVPNSGDFLTLDIADERALIVRGKDGEVRAFHNLCRHRGSRVAAEDQGNCKGALVCPFHGWVYNLDGTLRGPARPEGLPKLDRVEYGLKPLEQEIWNGFVFVRFKPSPQPSIAEILAPFAEEAAHYRMAEAVPTTGFWEQRSEVNWKSVRDVDNEGYHVAMAHPALQDLYGLDYRDEPFINGLSRSFATFNPGPGRRWSVKHYKDILPKMAHLPESHLRAWMYYGLFPNTVLGFTPEGISFYQEFPLATGQTQLRGGVYGLASDDRRTKLARYLARRIDRDTGAEDVMLTVWSCEAVKSSAFDGVILSDYEYGVKTYHDMLRKALPVLREKQEPAAGTLALLNEKNSALP